MTGRHTRVRLWAIWGMIAAFAVVQGVAWTIAGGIPTRPAVLVQVIAAWIIMLTLATISSRSIGRLSRSLSAKQDEHRETINEVEQLQVNNAMLQIIARSVDVPLAFQALAQRIVRLVACDRVGLALLTENGQEFQTYTARVHEQERRTRPRPEIMFKTERTGLGQVVRTREALLVDDTGESAQEYLDMNVLHTAGFKSALIVPLVSKGRAVGTLNVVSRQPHAFTQAHIDILLPIAEILAVAYVAQQLQVALGKYRTMETMADLTLSIATEINSALQTIIGHCDLLEREYPDPGLQRDLTTVVRQAQRISGLLEKMRLAAHDRLREVAETVSQSGIPSSPEGYGEREQV